MAHALRRRDASASPRLVQPVRTSFDPASDLACSAVSLTLEADTWQAIGALGSMVGAIAAAFGARAAWRAAAAAQTTSRDAMEALAVGMQPEVWADFYPESLSQGAGMPWPWRMGLGIRNSARWPASDVSIDVEFADGTHVRESHELLDTMNVDGDLYTVLRDVTSTWPTTEWEPVTAVVRFSDQRGIARYELRGTTKVRDGQHANGAPDIYAPTWTTRRLR